MYRTYSDQQFHPYEPKEDCIRLKDVAMYLAKTDVFRGQAEMAFPLAQFGMILAKAFESEEEKRAAMLFFAPELYCGFLYPVQRRDAKKYLDHYAVWYHCIIRKLVFRAAIPQMESLQFASRMQSSIRPILDIMYKQSKSAIRQELKDGWFKKMRMYYHHKDSDFYRVYPDSVAFEIFVLRFKEDTLT